MNKAKKRGFGFGVASGVITTLGLMTGLSSGFNSKEIVIGGILTIAIADALSDSVGTHISEETVSRNNKEAFKVMLYTFLSKFFVGISFLVPFLIFDMGLGLMISIIYGILLLGVYSYYIAKKKDKIRSVIEHVGISLIVILISYFVGQLVNLL